MEHETDLLTAADVARRFRVRPKTVWAWARGENPKLPAVRFGRKCVRFRPEDVERLIAEATCRG